MRHKRKALVIAAAVPLLHAGAGTLLALLVLSLCTGSTGLLLAGAAPLPLRATALAGLALAEAPVSFALPVLVYRTELAGRLLVELVPALLARTLHLPLEHALLGNVAIARFMVSVEALTAAHDRLELSHKRDPFKSPLAPAGLPARRGDPRRRCFSASKHMS
ncbi:hypothetical protein [Reticulibacter mediterranei]|uniref:hypothetical protein n=1 Tax=Reticulibacter mediterranei TaxID=2778369 RepID=UPI001C69226B|nr:hypothetical protein [Reticulibacter mediterranei]